MSVGFGVHRLGELDKRSHQSLIINSISNAILTYNLKRNVYCKDHNLSALGDEHLYAKVIFKVLLMRYKDFNQTC